MTFPNRGPSEDDNKLTSGTPPHVTRWEPEADVETTRQVEGGQPTFDNNGTIHTTESTPRDDTWLTSDEWDRGNEAWSEEPWTPQPAPEPKTANLGNHLLLLLGGVAFVVIGLLISSGSLQLFGTQSTGIWVAIIAIGGVFIVAGTFSGVLSISSADNPSREWKRVGRATIELTQTLILAVLIFLAVRSMAQNFRVEGASMEPGLHNGQYLLVNKAVYFKLNLETLDKFLPFIDPGDKPERFIFHAPRRGDVIVFEFPEDRSRDFIKRVIGVPGDTVKVENGVVFVNGKALDEDYVNHENRSNMDERVVPPNEYFVLGDNRGNSSDSRSWGFVPEENIIGRAMFTYWPDLGGVGNRTIDLGIIRVHLP